MVSSGPKERKDRKGKENGKEGEGKEEERIGKEKRFGGAAHAARAETLIGKTLKVIEPSVAGLPVG